MADSAVRGGAHLTVDLEDEHEHQDMPDGTFNDGCAWAVEAQTHRLLEVIDAAQARATFFVTGPVLERCPGLIQYLARHGHEVALHGPRHVMVYKLTQAEFRSEVAAAKARLEDAVGQHVTGYRAPSWSIVRRSAWALDELSGMGFDYDSSIFPLANPEYGVSGAPRRPYRLSTDLIEIPPSTGKIGPFVVPFSGGIYLRALPRALATRLAKRELEDHGLVLYVHPWELAPTGEHIPYPFPDRVVRRWGLAGTRTKLAALLALSQCRPLRESAWLASRAELPLCDPFARSHSS